ncbi:hypothetical protein ACB094_03G008200 [Castanea mollissima]
MRRIVVIDPCPLPNIEMSLYIGTLDVTEVPSMLVHNYKCSTQILGLDICADTLVGDATRRGINGGQKRRLTTGQMIIRPTKALSTAFQIVTCLQQLVHITDATVLIVYHGPRDHVLEFFEDCGFKCPERKAVADFVQEVICRKDEAEYWYHMEIPYAYVSVDMFSMNHKDALSFSLYSLSKWELFRACASRELLLMKRNSFIYIFKAAQVKICTFVFGLLSLLLFIIACITMTVFLHTQMDIDLLHGSYYTGALFYALILLPVAGIPELSITVQRLEILYKQKQYCFYPAWAYAIPASVLKVPVSFVESLLWTSPTYYVMGYSPEAQSYDSLIIFHVFRFFNEFILLFVLHFSSLSMFHFLACVFQTDDASISAASMPVWLKWGFWVSPLTYGDIGLSLNEFLAPRWQTMGCYKQHIYKMSVAERRMFKWISEDAHKNRIQNEEIYLKVGVTPINKKMREICLRWFAPGSSSAIISHEKHPKIKSCEDSCNGAHVDVEYRNSPPQTGLELNKGWMVLPVTPLTLVFQDVQYYVDTTFNGDAPAKDSQLLSHITGSLRPGVLTALMGVSGSGKSTLLDVLPGRKNSGYIDGQIKIGGYPKVQETFVRVSGYCEQADIHSPQITVEESVIFSAWLRLSPEIDSKTKVEFLNEEVLETIELGGIKNALAGIPGVTGLSTEQHKWLTIAGELVANPSIIFMDEPTTGLDARAAATVIQAVKNVADTGRTIVCTIHQPSIDIFEAFDELVLVKTGGHLIYSGPLGHLSTIFAKLLRVPKIRNNYNPATWMFEVTSTSVELHSVKNKEFVRQFSSPPPGSRDLHFITRFSQNTWGQLKSCLWNQNLAYWTSPAYNLMRIMHSLASALIFGNNQQDLLNIFGSMYATVIFLGINNCSAVIQYVIVEGSYLFIETAIFVTITYPMIGYYGSASTILSSAFYTIFNLFAGFLIPIPQIPKWWTWLYYLTSTSWSLNGLLASQYGDINKEILVFGETKAVFAFLEDYFGFHHIN